VDHATSSSGRVSARHRVQQSLALLRRNEVSAAGGLVVRARSRLRSDRLGGVAANSRNEDDDLRTDRRAVVKIDNARKRVTKH
jgi:hypothetical protein